LKPILSNLFHSKKQSCPEGSKTPKTLTGIETHPQTIRGRSQTGSKTPKTLTGIETSLIGCPIESIRFQNPQNPYRDWNLGIAAWSAHTFNVPKPPKPLQGLKQFR